MLAWQRKDDTFPFEREASFDFRDTAAVQHIRDHSRYLMPRGFGDLLDSIAVVLRGLVASASLAVAPLFLLAALTVFLNHEVRQLDGPHLALLPLPVDWPGGWFGTSLGVVAVTAFLFAWALARSGSEDRDGVAEFQGEWPKGARVALSALVGVAFLEAQPRLVDVFVILADQQTVTGSPKGFGPTALEWIKAAAAVLTPLAAIAALVVRQIQTVARTNEANATRSAAVARIAARALLFALAAALPLLLWLSYLYLSFWGVERATPDGTLYAPEWLASVAGVLSPGGHGMAALYCVFAVALLLTSWPLQPNSNSLHRLYRDRLARAFIFERAATMSVRTSEGAAGGDIPGTTDRSPPPIPDEVASIDAPIPLSSLGGPGKPYPLINVALNVQGSAVVNKRGRNADFFLLSPLYVGSVATGYAETSEFQKVEPSLNLAAAIAISGAAASPDMGSRTTRALTPTLALLNVRLGFWMRNPRHVAANQTRPTAWWRANLYLLVEMFGFLDENSDKVYLTDGGHIENLGVYELLRRQCATIVAIDAEADPELSFSSFVTLQRYARIDLGVRIELPWEGIRQRTRSTSEQVRALSTGGPAVHRHVGPHAVEGRILYPNGVVGRLVYVKASLSGDENDYVLDYKARNPAFPHEATADQFFSEEQFEAYRSLGFHAVFGSPPFANVPSPAEAGPTVQAGTGG